MLYSDVLALVKNPYGEKCQDELRTLLDGYRVQAKAVVLEKTSRGLSADAQLSSTARESLANELCDLWRKGSGVSDFEQSILTVIDRYRMQRKGSRAGAEAGCEPSSSKRTAPSAGGSALKPEGGPKTKTGAPAAASATKTKKKVVHEPLAGGPQKRSMNRGQCPKCHSMGVVLARSYANDEYFSCIYCGFQAFRASIDAELDLPLAAELLSRQFDDQDSGEDPEPA
jgi:hypothetical protein